MLDFFIKRLSLLGPLTTEETDALAALDVRREQAPAQRDVIREGAAVASCWVLLEGLACSYKLLNSGQRQILSLHVPGDACGLGGQLSPADHSVAAINECRFAVVGHDAIDRLTLDFPAVGRTLRRLELADAAVTRQWLVAIGRRSAYARTAHLLCELVERLARVGLGSNEGYDLPLTQTDLADALGLSVVHTNRVLQSLRGDGLISLSKSVLLVLDAEALQAAADFTPNYLYPADEAHREIARRHVNGRRSGDRDIGSATQ